MTLDINPFGDETNSKRLAVITIANDATGTPDSGNYECCAIYYDDEGQETYKTFQLEGWPRKEKGALVLLHNALEVIFSDKVTGTIKDGKLMELSNEDPSSTQD
jgi:hypothetical protein